jgi:hypothetical protein
MLALQGGMAVLVGAYYCWPTATAILDRLAAWQQAGGLVFAAIATGLAGGLLSELSLVYFQQRGHWTPSNFENIVFKLTIFAISGAMVCEFYRLQAIWWGQGASLSVVVPKVLVDQFGYTVVLSTPYYALLTRWQTLRYSGSRLWAELDTRFVIERMLPVLVTNWMFWIPTVILLYSMPTNLQTTIFIFATATWGLLLPAVVGQESSSDAQPMPAAPAPVLLAEPSE